MAETYPCACYTDLSLSAAWLAQSVKSLAASVRVRSYVTVQEVGGSTSSVTQASTLSRSVE